MHPKFTAALFAVDKKWEQPTCPLMDELKKCNIYIYPHTHMNVLSHTHNGILFSLKKEGNLVICNNMNGP